MPNKEILTTALKSQVFWAFCQATPDSASYFPCGGWQNRSSWAGHGTDHQLAERPPMSEIELLTRWRGITVLNL
jgi:hypothetical protein